ncbi:MAG TPA: DEAD/DEAH box helicase, partial [Chryseosolibacter sp.]|nr:DEAD/DEAH box helicase [Chryseosolibacter sp.]
MPDPLKVGKDWFREMGWTPFPFQLEGWQAYLEGASGLVNAPTGSGKTYSLMVPLVLEFLRHHPTNASQKNAGLQAIWITPIRALSKEIEISARRLINGLDIGMTVGIRSGDTSLKERMKQKTRPPHLLITTPESLHLLLAQKSYAELFKDLKVLIADEWHELMGSKRGVQVELALSRLKAV